MLDVVRGVISAAVAEVVSKRVGNAAGSQLLRLGTKCARIGVSLVPFLTSPGVFLHV